MKPLLLCTQTTIGLGVKPLLVHPPNHYWNEYERLLIYRCPTITSNHTCPEEQKEWLGTSNVIGSISDSLRAAVTLHQTNKEIDKCRQFHIFATTSIVGNLGVVLHHYYI